MITVVVGGQFGGEGKGKLCSYLVSTRKINLMVRCGGPNSGHTVVKDGVTSCERQVEMNKFR